MFIHLLYLRQVGLLLSHNIDSGGGELPISFRTQIPLLLPWQPRCCPSCTEHPPRLWLPHPSCQPRHRASGSEHPSLRSTAQHTKLRLGSAGPGRVHGCKGARFCSSQQTAHSRSTPTGRVGTPRVVPPHGALSSCRAPWHFHSWGSSASVRAGVYLLKGLHRKPEFRWWHCLMLASRCSWAMSERSLSRLGSSHQTGGLEGWCPV